MMDLTIKEIAQACGGKLVVQGGKADSDTCVSSVVIDSRAVEPGGVFIATVGERVDGHCFIRGAFEKGAVLAVTQKTPEEMGEAGGEAACRKNGDSVAQMDTKMPEEMGEAGGEAAGRQNGDSAARMDTKMPEEMGEAGGEAAGRQNSDSVAQTDTKAPEEMEEDAAPAWGCYVLVEDTLQALKDIAEAYRKKLSAKVIGITGSVGKTSTKEFIAGVLAEKYNVLKTSGNFNNEIGVPLTLLRIRKEHELAVVEMGISDFGEMRRLSKMARPDVCVITNIGQSHLNNLKDRDGILRAKSEIFDYMSVDGEICLNGEDDKLNGLEEIKGHKPHFFGLGSSSSQEVAAVDIVGRGLWGSDATLMMAPGRTAWNGIMPGEDTGALGAQPEKMPEIGGTKAEETAYKNGVQAGETPGMDGAEEAAHGDGVQAGETPGMDGAEEAAHGDGVQAGETPEMGGTKLANTADINNAETDGTAKDGDWPGYHRLPVHVSQPGRHMVLNAAAAACVARLFGLTGEQIAAGVAKVAAVDGRTHIISHPRHTIIDDCYNANPASVKAALDLLALADTRKVAILGDMLNLGENSHDYHAQIGSYAVEAGIDTILCVGEESRYMYQAAAERANLFREVSDQTAVPQEALDQATACRTMPEREKRCQSMPDQAETNQTAPHPCRVLHFSNRKALLDAMAADSAFLIPKGSSILVKASHDCGFSEILAFLQAME